MIYLTIAIFRWFSRQPSPLNGMVGGNLCVRWVSDGFGVPQLSCTDGFKWSSTIGQQCDAMDHRSSLVKYSKPLEAINCPFYSLYLRIVMYRQLAITSYNTWMYWKRGQNSLLV